MPPARRNDVAAMGSSGRKCSWVNCGQIEPQSAIQGCAILASRSDDHAVVEMNNAASEAALTEQLEPHAEVVRQCSLTSPQDDRMKE